MMKKTTITWASAADQNHADLSTARTAKLIEMARAGQVHLIEAAIVNDVTTVRYWKDQSAAEEFVAFIQAQATTHGVSVVSAVIEDYVE